MNFITKAGIGGFAIGGLSYLYNNLGEKGKLSKNMPFLTPSKTAAITTGAITFLALVSFKKPIIPLVGGLGMLTLYGLENSIKEVKEFRKQTLAKTDCYIITDRINEIRVRNLPYSTKKDEVISS